MTLLKNLEAVRQDFPIFEKKVNGHPLVYLDSAATCHKPQVVIDTISHFYTHEYGTVHRAVYELAALATLSYNEVREKAKDFLNAATSEEIIFTKGTTEAINLIAFSFGEAFIKEDDEIIITELEHHSNIVPWQMLALRKKAKLKIIPSNDKGELCLDEFKNLLTPRTKIVSVAHIANSVGTIHPIETIIQMAHEKGAKVFIDGAQAASHLPVDVRALDADFYAFSGHKAFGPTGIGILYGKKELLEEMPPFLGGSDMISEVGLDSSTFQKPPLRFEPGTPMIAEVIGLGAALDYIESLGRQEIFAYEEELLHYALERLSEIERVQLMGAPSQRGALISFTVKGIHALDIGTLLNLKGICVRTGHLCAQPALRRFGISSLVRLSFAPYNTKQDIDLFISALKNLIHSV